MSGLVLQVADSTLSVQMQVQRSNEMNWCKQGRSLAGFQYFHVQMCYVCGRPEGSFFAISCVDD